MTDSLLIELRTEELPPKALEHLSNSLASAVVDGLKKLQFIIGQAEYTVFASPRRLAMLIKHVHAMQSDQVIIKKGPSLAVGLHDGEPTQALIGFARANHVDINELVQINDGKQQVFAYQYTQQGQSLAAVLSDVLSQAIKKLPIPKVMHWGSSEYVFVRPVHGLIMMYGAQVVSGEVLGLTSSNWTLGHRFLSSQPIVLQQADDYEQQMKQEGKVLASYDKRRSFIQQELERQAKQCHASVVADDDLLNEVTALVEWPEVLQASFESHFLTVPQECLILTMQQNQKYFPLLDDNGRLLPKFLLVSNLQIDDPSQIILGNERVLRARLSDAEFFFNQDKKISLSSRLPQLAHVVYQHKLGSQAARVARIKSLTVTIASLLGADVELAARAATLSKADLLTEMVGEFPELQGTMGKYYALHDGENEEVALAIEQHYQPRYAGDDLPSSLISCALALADKLETLVGIWGIGLIPTGDKDPYALRRCALGVVRILMRHGLALKPILQAAFDTFSEFKLNEHTVSEVSKFILARLSVLLNNDFMSDEVAAVLAVPDQNLGDVVAKLQAVATFKTLPESMALAAANKRVHNLLKKVGDQPLTDVSKHLLQQQEEQQLFQATKILQSKIQTALVHKDFQQALTLLAGIKPKVDAFFDEVMVMDKNEDLRRNRLSLLYLLSQQMNAVANIALLHEA